MIPSANRPSVESSHEEIQQNYKEFDFEDCEGLQAEMKKFQAKEKMVMDRFNEMFCKLIDVEIDFVSLIPSIRSLQEERDQVIEERRSMEDWTINFIFEVTRGKKGKTKKNIELEKKLSELSLLSE